MKRIDMLLAVLSYANDKTSHLNSCAEPVALPGALLDSVGTFAEIDLTYAVHHLQEEHKMICITKLEDRVYKTLIA